MKEVIGNIIEIFIYSIVFIFALVVSLKIVGSVFSANFEREIIEEKNISLSIVLSSVAIALAILFSTIIG